MAFDFSRFLARFLEEARGHLGLLEDGLCRLRQDPGDLENIRSLFRSAHTIKGAAGMLKLRAVAETADHLEEALSALREGRIGYGWPLAELLLQGVRALALQVEGTAAGEQVPHCPELCAALARAAAGEAVQAAADGTQPAPPAGEPTGRGPRLKRTGIGSYCPVRARHGGAPFEALLVGVGGHGFAIAADSVQQTLREPETELIALLNLRAVKLGNEFIPIALLADLLALPGPAARAEAADPLLVVVGDGSGKFALQVDELPEPGDPIGAPLPERLANAPLLGEPVQSGHRQELGLLQVPALLAAARAAQERAMASGSVQAPSSISVLVVDDSLSTREIEKGILEAHGYRVSLAADGLEALDQARAARFDLIVTDLEMPRLDGFQLTSRLRALRRYRQTPIIMVSSREKPEDRRRGLEAGADAYIVKRAFDQNDLLETMRRLIAEKIPQDS